MTVFEILNVYLVISPFLIFISLKDFRIFDMKQEYDIRDLLRISKCNKVNSENNAKKKFVQVYLNLQHVNRQINLINYINLPTTEIPSNLTLTNLTNSIRRPPFKFISKFSSHILNRVSDWLLTFITKPDIAADAVSNHFLYKDNFDSQIFAFSAFPSIYHQFVTYELQNAASKFLNRILDKNDLVLFCNLIYSFLASNHLFFTSLWETYDSQIRLDCSSSNHFYIFLKSLGSSANSLTSFQHDILYKLFQTNCSVFSELILKKLFIMKYMEFFNDFSNESQNSEIATILCFAADHPQSPQFKRIVDKLFSANYYKSITRHCETNYDNQTPILLSSYELLILQDIVQSNKKIFNYPDNEPEMLQIPKTCQYDFECYVSNINLRPIFGSDQIKSSLKIDESFMFKNLHETPVENSTNNQIQWERLSIVSKSFGTSELDIFLYPQQVPEAKQYIEKIPFNNHQFYDYLVCRFKNSIISDLKLFDSFIYKKSVWGLFSDALDACYSSLNISLSNITKRITAEAYDETMASNKRMTAIRNIHKSTNLIKFAQINPNELVQNANNETLKKIGSVINFDLPQLDESPLKLEPESHDDSEIKSGIPKEFFQPNPDPEPIAHQRQKQRSRISRVQTISVINPPDLNFEQIASSGNSIEHRNSHGSEVLANSARQDNSSKPKKRRVSERPDTKELDHNFKVTLDKSISEFQNNDTKLLVYICNLDMFNLEDKSVVQLGKKYHELMDGLRLKNAINNKFNDLQRFPYLKRCSEKIEALVYYRKGTALLKLAQIILEINQICQLCFFGSDSYIKLSSDLFQICLLMANNDVFYELFVWYQKMCFCFPDFRSFIPQSMQLMVASYEASFWQFLKNLQASLFEQTKDSCQYLFQ